MNMDLKKRDMVFLGLFFASVMVTLIGLLYGVPLFALFLFIPFGLGMTRRPEKDEPRGSFCPECGSPMDPGDSFCRVCGRKL